MTSPALVSLGPMHPNITVTHSKLQSYIKMPASLQTGRRRMGLNSLFGAHGAGFLWERILALLEGVSSLAFLAHRIGGLYLVEQ